MDFFIAFFAQLNLVSGTILLLLSLLSILTWYIIFSKFFQLIIIYWQSRFILTLFWQHTSLSALITYLSNERKKHPFANLARQGINTALYYQRRQAKQLPNLCSQNDFLTRNLQQAMRTESFRLEAGLTLLASTGNTAPFIGLLGTVLGIYHALYDISSQGNASLATIATPVGEALLMTALGLAVAIPAVLGYNALLRGNRIFLNRLETFSHDLQTCLNTGARIDINDAHFLHYYWQPEFIEK